MREPVTGISFIFAALADYRLVVFNPMIVFVIKKRSAPLQPSLEICTLPDLGCHSPFELHFNNPDDERIDDEYHRIGRARADRYIEVVQMEERIPRRNIGINDDIRQIAEILITRVSGRGV